MLIDVSKTQVAVRDEGREARERIEASWRAIYESETLLHHMAQAEGVLIAPWVFPASAKVSRRTN